MMMEMEVRLLLSNVLLLSAPGVWHLSHDVFGADTMQCADIFYMFVCAGIALRLTYRVIIRERKDYLENLVLTGYGLASGIYFLDFLLLDLIRRRFPLKIIAYGLIFGLVWECIYRFWVAVRHKRL